MKFVGNVYKLVVVVNDMVGKSNHYGNMVKGGIYYE